MIIIPNCSKSSSPSDTSMGMVFLLQRTAFHLSSRVCVPSDICFFFLYSLCFVCTIYFLFLSSCLAITRTYQHACFFVDLLLFLCIILFYIMRHVLVRFGCPVRFSLSPSVRVCVWSSVFFLIQTNWKKKQRDFFEGSARYCVPRIGHWQCLSSLWKQRMESDWNHLHGQT